MEEVLFDGIVDALKSAAYDPLELPAMSDTSDLAGRLNTEASPCGPASLPAHQGAGEFLLQDYRK
jgi:hypothetical protein